MQSKGHQVAALKFTFSLNFLRAEFKERVKMLIRSDYLRRIVEIVQTA
jgi:hypothetical protein